MRTIASQVFLYDVLHGRVKEPYLLSKLNINLPRLHSRIKNMFWPPVASTNALKHAIMNRASECYNRLSDGLPDLDIFHLGRESYKKVLQEAVM